MPEIMPSLHQKRIGQVQCSRELHCNLSRNYRGRRGRSHQQCDWESITCRKGFKGTSAAQGTGCTGSLIGGGVSSGPAPLNAPSHPARGAGRSPHRLDLAAMALAAPGWAAQFAWPAVADRVEAAYALACGGAG